ncbi:hypothetical protein H2200_008544 [Cladophialophora chaetospira]|uniref:Pisatin demethylase n=1 Tax=Cladophialophora chaetospira TaxID=386627 RepID=A0AA39CFM1_9EURO|nr:hypothetical protein H2200_008544 [Cladophialophora chaetospira]
MVSSSLWPWTVVIAALAVLFLRYRRLSAIPGPFLASVTDVWRFYRTNNGTFYDTLKQLHDQHGSLVRIGPNAVSISDPAAIPIVHSMHGEFRKADSHSVLRMLVNGKIMGSVVDLQDENEVSALKRAVGSAFATKNLLDYEPDVDNTLERLVQTIRRRRTVSLLDVMQQFQVDFLMQAAFSKHTDYLESDRSTLAISGDFRLRHWLRWQSMPAVEWLLYKSPLCSAWYKRGTAKPQAWTAMAIEEMGQRQKMKPSDGTGGQKPDLLSKYLFSGDRHKENVSDQMILRLVSSTIAAGFDTSAYTMMTIFYNLLKHPEAMRKLRFEIDDALNHGRLSNPPRFTETDKFEYLGAVIKETMRLLPFLKTLLEREVPAGGAEIAGQVIPGGTIVGISTQSAHRDRAVFGKDADAFRPDRWLEADHQHRLLMERSVLGFGAGKRVCIGRHIAELEMKKVIPTLLLEFDISLQDPSYVLKARDRLTNFPTPFAIVCEDRVG